MKFIVKGNDHDTSSAALYYLVNKYHNGKIEIPIEELEKIADNDLGMVLTFEPVKNQVVVETPNGEEK
jgi:hypothetical protein